MTKYMLQVWEDGVGMTGQHDITEEIEGFVTAAGALGRAIKARMEEHGESSGEALERLTANYSRAEIEESGFDAVQNFLTAADIEWQILPDDDEVTA